MDELSKKMNIKYKEEWFRISPKKLNQEAGVLMEKYNNSLEKLLQTIYPEYLR